MLRRFVSLFRFSYDNTDLVFRGLFSLIFLALGGEHLFQDEIIQRFMPAWVPFPRLASVAAGLVLLSGGTMVAFGYKTRQAAVLLGAFLVGVTALVHVPELFAALPPGLPPEWEYLWQTYQRSNTVKNLCLLGVCFHLVNHRLGRHSLDIWLKRRREGSGR